MSIPLTGCQAGTAGNESNEYFGSSSMTREVTLNVVLYSYLERPIFDVYLNGKWVGDASAYGGGGGIISGVPVTLGPQALTWRLDGPKGTPRNGEVVSAKRALSLSPDQIPPDARYLGVHIYPDETAELNLSRYIPEATARGREIRAERTNGK